MSEHFDESELRAALREGEGTGRVPSAGSIMARAEAIRSARHMRIRNAAAAVVVIGAVGTGVGVLASHGGSDSGGSADSANAAAGGANAATAPEFSGQAPPAAAAGTAASGAAPCPSRPADVSVPHSGAAGTSGPLFAEPVASLTACGYRADHVGGTYTLRATTTLAGAQARRLAGALEGTSTTYRPGLCPGASHPVVVTLYARTSSGAALPVVVIDESVPCPVTITNGTAARYATLDELPGSLAALTK